MRRDFAKLVFERPKSNRTWMRKTPRPAPVAFTTEGDVANEAEQHYLRRRQKFAGDGRFNPVRRFLVRQVGRPWARVFAELCETADARSYTGATVRDAALWFVETDCFVRQGVICALATGEPVKGLFVDPRSGLLRRAPDQPRMRKGT